MQELTVLGKEKVGMFEFTGIEGGFGNGKKSMLVKDIAEIHESTVGNVNLLINRNRKRFKDGIDIIDLKDENFAIALNKSGFSQNQINASKYIYLLSERGYAKLLKILEDDTAWEIYDELVDNYFNMQSDNLRLPQSPTEMLKLAIDSTLETAGKVDALNTRMDEFEQNARLDPSEYGWLGKKINAEINYYVSANHLELNQKQRSKLYSDINRGVNEVAGVSTRTQIRKKDWEVVLKYLRQWTPSAATLVMIEQIGDEVKGQERLF